MGSALKKIKITGDQVNKAYPYDPARYLWATWSLSALFLALYLFKPGAFGRLALEAGVIENFSALFLLGASILLALAFIRHKEQSNALRVCLAVGSLVLFVMAMEEISWFQSFLGFRTPDYFAGNSQNETNLHNFYTDTFEYLFYNGSFVLLGLLPFIKQRSLFLQTHPLTRHLVGDELVFFTALLAVGFSDDIGHSITTQAACLLAAILLIFCIVGKGASKSRIIPSAWLVLHVLVTAVFYLYPERSHRAWEMTEYKEFFLSLGYLVSAHATLNSVNSRGS